MKKSELLKAADDLLSEVKTAVLSTVGNDNEPRMRWMSPIFIRGISDSLYAVTSSAFNKTGDLKKNKRVQWMIQSKSLDRIITLNGEIEMVENISLRSEVIENMGSLLYTFWKNNNNDADLVVLETVLTGGLIFYPAKGRKEAVSFKEGE